jgi:hypothetical protein
LSKSSEPSDKVDFALALAVKQMKWYNKYRILAAMAYSVGQILLLLATAGTTIAAALKAPQWVTASLAATSLIVVGLLRIFDWHDSWVSWSNCWAELNVSINRYCLLPEEKRNQAAKEELVQKVNDLIITDTRSWTIRRRYIAQQEASKEAGESSDSHG